MADNVGYTPGAGAEIAADDVGGVLYQRIKLAVGDDGTAQDVSDAQPLPVNIISDDSITTSLMLQYLDSPRGFDKSLQRQRGTAIIESGTLTAVTTVTTVTTVSTVTAVTTVGSVTNLASLGGIQGQIQVNGQNLSAWHACVRSRIT
jgi:hypothetical protein